MNNKETNKNFSQETLPEQSIEQESASPKDETEENLQASSELNSTIKKKLRFPIRSKLMGITSIVVFLSLAIVTFITLDIFRTDMSNMIAVINSRSSSLLADKIETKINDIIKNFKFINKIMHKASQNRGVYKEIKANFFGTQSDYIYTSFYQKNAFNHLELYNELFNDDRLKQISLDKETIKNGLKTKKDILNRIFSGETVVENVSPLFNAGIWLIGFPDVDEDGFLTSATVTLISIDSMLKMFLSGPGGGSLTRSFLVDSNGKILIHPDKKFILIAKDMNKHPGVARLFSSKTQKGLLRYTFDHTDSFAAYEKIAIINAGIITTIPAAKALEGVKTVQYRSILISLAILSLMLIFIYFFAHTISSPVKDLVKATKKINEGDYETSLVPKTNDEIGDLTQSFTQMANGLAEREKLKGALGKFVNEEIANQVLAGELKLGGDLTKATIFFSDIRSFTAISEKLSPAQVVEFLNDYMTRMVRIVQDTNGVVDKFIGDAIMAVWGAPVSHGNDAENCINAALKMRKELIEFNKDRGGPDKPIIKIGSGINTGEVLAGQIGSDDRLEYTVIGDAVNLASRVEALNKPFGTDILISTDTLNVVEGIFNVTPMQKIKVKGKEEPQQIYAVLGRKDDLSAPKTLEEMRKMVGIEPPKETKGTEEKEVKYEIIDEPKSKNKTNITDNEIKDNHKKNPSYSTQISSNEKEKENEKKSTTELHNPPKPHTSKKQTIEILYSEPLVNSTHILSGLAVFEEEMENHEKKEKIKDSREKRKNETIQE